MRGRGMSAVTARTTIPEISDESHESADGRFALIVQLQRELARVESDGAAIMALIGTYTERLLGASGVAVAMVEGDEAVYRAARGMAMPFLDRRLPRSQSLTGLAIHMGEVVHCLDSETDGRVDRGACQKVGVRSFVVVPLRHDHRYIGGLEVLAPAPHAFGTRDVETLQVLGGFLAAALSHVIAAEANQTLMHECTGALGALLDSEERYRRLVQLSPDAIIVEADGAYLFANAAAARLFGVARAEEVVGRAIDSFMDHDEATAWYARNERELSPKAEHLPYEMRYRRANGEVVPVESVSMPIDYHGQRARMSVLRDLTERRAAETALRATETRYRSVVAALEEGIVVQDVAGRITAMNGSAERIFGFFFADIEEQIGLDPRLHATYEDGSFFPDDDYPAMVVLRTGVPESHVIMGFQRSGDSAAGVTWVSVNAQPLFDPGESMPYAVVSTFTNITERKATDEALRRNSAELQRSNRELQDFASVTSHDLKEPLRKIRALGTRLEDRCKDSLPAEGRDYLNRMLNAAERMDQLVDDVLTYSRVSSKEQPFVRVDLNEIAAAVLSDLEVRVEQTGATVTMDPLPIIEADPLQMRQLFQNLIGNALKFTMEGIVPTVKVTAHIAPSRERGKGTHSICHLVVQDNGIGFDEKYLEKIFTVFQRLNNRSHYEGSGVGLAICRKIAERHGGTITARSAPGQGATFMVTLPVEHGIA